MDVSPFTHPYMEVGEGKGARDYKVLGDEQPIEGIQEPLKYKAGNEKENLKWVKEWKLFMWLMCKAENYWRTVGLFWPNYHVKCMEQQKVGLQQATSWTMMLVVMEKLSS